MKSMLGVILFFLLTGSAMAQSFTMPAESGPHEGTWLQWPHPYEYGVAYRNSLEDTWVAMTAALVGSENVHIIAYNQNVKQHIIQLLQNAHLSLQHIDFYIFPTNDVWVRDNGPVFVHNQSGRLFVQDWGFNGWGGKFRSNFCDKIPAEVGYAIHYPTLDLNETMTLEGGAIELDGNGVLLACRSSIISQSPPNSVRNPGMTQTKAENILKKNLGITKFIWLNGKVGDPEDVTDFHIDGFAKFLNDQVMVTMSKADLLYWGTSLADIHTLYQATNLHNRPYKKIFVPLTKKNVITTNGENLGYKGSYVNYYVANKVVLVPNYNDPNDTVANAIIQQLYPDRTVVGIDVRNLYKNGGMVHCVTQQQPASTTFDEQTITQKLHIQISPNPFSVQTTISTTTTLVHASFRVTDWQGRVVKKIQDVNGYSFVLTRDKLPPGIYFLQVIQNGVPIADASLQIIP